MPSASRGRQVDGSFMASITFNRTKTVKLIGSPMSLPHYASRGPVGFLCCTMSCAGRRATLIVLLAVLARRRLRHRRPVRGQEPRRRARPRQAVRLRSCGARWRCCWGWSPATTCCGGSPAGSRPMPSSPSAATFGSTCSSISSGHGTRYFADRFPGALAGAHHQRRQRRLEHRAVADLDDHPAGCRGDQPASPCSASSTGR